MNSLDLKKMFSTEKLEGFFSHEESSLVGLDIGCSNIKIIELEKKEAGLILKNYAFVKLDKKILAGNSRDHFLKEIIKKTKQELDWNIDGVNVAISSANSFVTAVDFWDSPDDEIDQIIQTSVSKYIPIPLEEVIYGWKIVKIQEKPLFEKKDEVEIKKEETKNVEKIKEKKKAVIVAVMKDFSRRQETLLTSCDIGVEVLEIDSFSLARCFGKEDQNLLIVDVGDVTTNLTAVAGRDPILVKNIDFGGEKVTNVFMNALKVDFSRADKLKKDRGLNIETTEVKDNVLMLLSSLKGEVISMIENFNKDFVQNPVSGIVLTGGGSNLIGLKEYLEQETKLAINRGNPFEKIIIPEAIIARVSSLQSFFSVAIGLAMLNDKEK